ncbi:MAG: adenylate kinase [Bdellovibrionales bacterium]|nr:adenylate kinase [Bdellovibrionales bacterium]NQZ17697.1 adenylate kinase [Bdellovibrionales bacterium]
MSIVLFGPPGAGKGTQAEKMISNSSKSHISTGDLFRAAMKNQTPLGLEAKSYVDSGKLVPDSVTIGLVREVLEKNKEGDFIFDGFPRTSPQAEALEQLIEEMGVSPIKHALFLEVPQETLLKRLTGRRLCRDCGAVYHVESNPTTKEGVCDKCGGETYQRKDDGEDVISTRLDAYTKSTEPLKDYYQQKGLFVAIDGLGDPESVFSRFQPYL